MVLDERNQDYNRFLNFTPDLEKTLPASTARSCLSTNHKHEKEDVLQQTIILVVDGLHNLLHENDNS